MLANRPKGISINRNVNNVKANALQSLKLAGTNNANNLKRGLQSGLDAGPLKPGQLQHINQQDQNQIKKLPSQTPSPLKLKTQQSANNVIKQSENDVPMLVDIGTDSKVTDKQSKLEEQTNQPIERRLTRQQSFKKIKELLLEEQPVQKNQPLQLQPVNTQANINTTNIKLNTKTVISRIPRLREVEEEPIEDIDKSSAESRDAIFQVCDVAKDIYSYMYELEEVQSVKEDFLKEQKIFTPKVRQRLVRWMMDLSIKLELLPETMYMTISIIDRYFDTVIVKQQNHVQLVALGCMLVASKYEEIYPPDVNDLMTSAENAYTRRDIMRMEIEILEKLNFDLGKPIPLAFLRRFSKAAHCDMRMHSIAKFFMEISLPEYECAHWKPSFLAAAALFTTVHLVLRNSPVTDRTPGLKTTRLSAVSAISNFGLQRRISAAPTHQDRWNKTLIHYTSYSRKDLQKASATLCDILKRVLKNPHLNCRNHINNLAKWPELKSTRVDELIRLGQNVK